MTTNAKGMKPSERIQQLVEAEHKRRPAQSGMEAVDIGLNAIVKFLDEQHEAKGGSL